MEWTARIIASYHKRKLSMWLIKIKPKTQNSFFIKQSKDSLEIDHLYITTTQ